VRPLTADLQQMVHSLPASASQAAGATGNGSGNGAGSAAEADEGEVVDAEFTRE
jgi:hypothetical protein